VFSQDVRSCNADCVVRTYHAIELSSGMLKHTTPISYYPVRHLSRDHIIKKRSVIEITDVRPQQTNLNASRKIKLHLLKK
jgi:hypothetical protein